MISSIRSIIVGARGVVTEGEIMFVIAAKVKIKMQNNSPRQLKHAAEVNDALHSGEKRSEERQGNMGGDH